MNIIKLWEDNKGIIDNGFFFGIGVFETIKINKEPIFLKDHISRLNDGLKKLRINEVIDCNLVYNIIKERKLQDIALKIAVSEKNIVFSTREITYNDEDYNKGFIINLSDVKRNSTSNINNIKSLNYMENILEKQNSKLLGYDEPIFINEKDELCEGATTNIFLVKDGIIKTPYIKSGLLNGIIRKYVIKNFQVDECRLTMEDLKESNEIILTNSLLGIMWVSRFEEKLYNKGKIYNEVKRKYEKHIGVNWREI